MHIFQAFMKIFLRCDVTRLLDVMVMFPAFETFNLDAVLTKIKIISFCTNVVHFFCNNFRDLLLRKFYKAFKTRSKVLN